MTAANAAGVTKQKRWWRWSWDRRLQFLPCPARSQLAQGNQTKKWLAAVMGRQKIQEVMPQVTILKWRVAMPLPLEPIREEEVRWLDRHGDPNLKCFLHEWRRAITRRDTMDDIVSMWRFPDTPVCPQCGWHTFSEGVYDDWYHPPAHIHGAFEIAWWVWYGGTEEMDHIRLEWLERGGKIEGTHDDEQFVELVKWIASYPRRPWG
jgi:hypothetical protein